ncbi:MAG: cytochrome ubiquinol oxidase subunit I, partial [Ignavibacteriaceae bacterium]
FKQKWLMWAFVFSVLLPQIANQVGWITAEVGRQPWIVYGLLRTSEGLSKAVSADQVWFSLILFTLIYIGLFILFVYLLNEKIKHGPEDVDAIPSEIGHPKS